MPIKNIAKVDKGANSSLKKTIQKKLGMSLVETMIALGVMAIAGASFVSFMTDSRKYQKSAESLSNRNMLFQNLQRAILSPQNMRRSYARFMPADGSINSQLAACVMFLKNDKDCIHGFGSASSPSLNKDEEKIVKDNGFPALTLTGQSTPGIPGYVDFELFGANGALIAGSNVSYNLLYERCNKKADKECPIEAKVFMAPVCETGVNIGDRCEIAEGFRFLVTLGQRANSNFITDKVKKGSAQLVGHLFTDPSAPITVELKDFKKTCGVPDDLNILSYDALGNPVCYTPPAPSPGSGSSTAPVEQVGSCTTSEGKSSYTYHTLDGVTIYAYDSDEKKKSECVFSISAKFCAVSRFACDDCDGTASMRCSAKHTGVNTWEFKARSSDSDDKQVLLCSVACMN